VAAARPGARLDVEIRAGRRRVETTFRDTGRGIAGEDLGRLFNPFFTTKDKNLGLGLAVSHRIIDAHQGLIHVRSRPGHGASVTVTLPALSARPRTAKH
ncbi:MAG: ATP-binding protein, partial [Thermodesulfobacteriota bacterium]